MAIRAVKAEEALVEENMHLECNRFVASSRARVRQHQGPLLVDFLGQLIGLSKALCVPRCRNTGQANWSFFRRQDGLCLEGAKKLVDLKNAQALFGQGHVYPAALLGLPEA